MTSLFWDVILNNFESAIFDKNLILSIHTTQYRLTNWLPISDKEVKALGWESIDVMIFSGDAYVDHPSFGAAVIGRVLENQGLKVAIVPQPNWRDDLRNFKKLRKLYH